MSQAEETLALLRHAQACVHEAAGRWQPANLENVQECRETLEVAVGALREVETGLQICAASEPRANGPLMAAIRSTLMALKRDMFRLDRIVGSASAFLRGAERVTGPAAPVYGAQGEIEYETQRLACQVAEG